MASICLQGINNGRDFIKAIPCVRCSHIFYMCRSCWRGHVYCCEECRRAARLEAHCQVQRIYRQTDKGRKAHKEAERRRRIRYAQNSVADTPTTSPYSPYRISKKQFPITPCCSICGKMGPVVDQFSPRRYGGRRDSGPDKHFF